MPRSGSYAVLDFETTGLAPRTDEVVETGAVHVDRGRLGAEFHALSRPVLPIPPSVIRVHGITNEMVAGEPPFGEVVGSLLEFLGDRTIVAHHARFDCAFLDAAAQRAGLSRPENAVLDTVRLSRRLFPHLDRHDLSSLCVTHRIRRPQAHRALDDARATAGLLEVLFGRAEQDGLSDGELMLAGRPGSWRGEKPRRRVTLEPAELERLEEALVTGDVLDLGYVSARGNPRRAEVVPYRLDAVSRAPRLVAYDVAAGRTRIWPLERVTAVAEPGGELMTLEEIRARLGDCRRCALHETRNTLVFGAGNPQADIVLVGEAPGAREDAKGIPFVGAAGNLLDSMLARIDLERSDIYIANVLKCRPPKNRNPRPEEIETCVPFLFEQLGAIAPRVVGTLGNFSTRLLLGTREGITGLRLQVFDVRGFTVVPMYHPAAALHNGALRGEIARDFEFLRDRIHAPEGA